MASFEERIYELGAEALGEQERQVAEVRGRGATLLAAGAVIASLLATPVFTVATQTVGRKSRRRGSGYSGLPGYWSSW